jgi:predicted HTH transcriptional regulator
MYTLIDRAVDLIMTKYTVTPFEFKGMTRIEHYPYPPVALREALLNAVVNTDFRQHLPVKIDVLDDRINIFNSGSLPPGYSLKELAEGHISKPLNDGLANAFYRSYYVEKFGMGMKKMSDEYDGVGVKPPEYTILPDGIMITLADILHEKGLAPSGAAGSLLEISGGKMEFTENQIMALRFMKRHGETTNEDLQKIIGLKRERIRTTVILPLMGAGFIEMTDKCTPHSMNQSYVLSKKGLTIIFND